jgi:hypothetical protein
MGVEPRLCGAADGLCRRAPLLAGPVGRSHKGTTPRAFPTEAVCTSPRERSGRPRLIRSLWREAKCSIRRAGRGHTRAKTRRAGSHERRTRWRSKTDSNSRSLSSRSRSLRCVGVAEQRQPRKALSLLQATSGSNPPRSTGESARADPLGGPGRAIVFNRRTPAMAAGLLPV